MLFCTVFSVSVFVWVLQRSKMSSALQLAKMQMDFVASVSHELRTPLAVLCSAADNIADGVVREKEQLTKYSAVIRNQSRQINDLVNEVILFASTQNGKGRYVLRPLEVGEIIESAITGTAELIQRAGFVLEQQVAPALPRVMGDPSALSQCLQNLLINALKYGDRGRWICIRASLEAGRDHRHHREIRISVQDRGTGIDRADLPHIFEPFIVARQPWQVKFMEQVWGYQSPRASPRPWAADSR